MSERKLSVTITGPEGMLEAMAKLLRDEGWSVTSPSEHAEQVRLGRAFWANVDDGHPGAVELAALRPRAAEADALLARVVVAFHARKIAALPSDLLEDITKYLGGCA